MVFTSVAHLPGGFFHWAFDRNALPQFLALVLLSSFCALHLIISKRVLNLPRVITFSLIGLFLSTLISILTSHNFYTGLTGDAGRFTGLVSLYALVIVAIWGANLGGDEWESVFRFILISIVLVDLIGFGQSLHLYALPGDGGIGSTLGNLDFLSAWMGTTTILIFVHKSSRRAIEISKYLLLPIIIFTLIRIGAKQGILDFILLLPFLIGYRFRNLLKRMAFAQGFWTSLISVGLIMWCEVIYLTPMAKVPIPGVAGDANVDIRSDFWFSGITIFFKNILFGVGPDNYGYYYEQYRSLHSVKTAESVITNDAHSSMVQSFATLGIFAVLIFLLLLLYLVRSYVQLLAESTHRRRYGFLAVFSFIFMTNSLISPITLPNKAIFWLISGFVIGQAHRPRSIRFKTWRKGAVGIIAAISLFVGANTATAFVKMNFADDASHSKNGKVSYSFNPYLPCVLYFSKQIDLSVQAGKDPIVVAQAQVSANPRCLDAQLYLANAFLTKRDVKSARKPIYALLEIAPARKEIIRLAAIYAIQAKDSTLLQRISASGLHLTYDKKSGKILIS